MPSRTEFNSKKTRCMVAAQRILYLITRGAVSTVAEVFAFVSLQYRGGRDVVVEGDAEQCVARLNDMRYQLPARTRRGLSSAPCGGETRQLYV